jgi:hypothetical protein
MPPFYFLTIIPAPAIDIAIRGLQETGLGIIYKKLAPYSSLKYQSFSNHYASKEWIKDIYSTMSFNNPVWIGFNVKDWLLFFTSNLFHQKTQKKNARQTFDELLLG